jgi:hypothetical protein
VFDYLEKHNALTEAEMVQLLGNARKARAFAARFDGFLERLTFEVEGHRERRRQAVPEEVTNGWH